MASKKRLIAMLTQNPAVYFRTPAQRLGFLMICTGFGGLILLFVAISLNSRHLSSATRTIRGAPPTTLVAKPGAGSVIKITSDNTPAYQNTKIPRYEKFEVSFTIGNVGDAFTDYNPFNPNITRLSGDYWNKKGILVDAILTSPRGRSITYPCFWYEGSDGWKGWKLRFAPTDPGTWKYRLRARHAGGETITGERSFSCAAGPNHGFVGVNPSDPRFFRFSDGTPFYPIGCDTSGWDKRDFLYRHRVMFPKLRAAGANFSRIFASMEETNLEPYCVGGDKSVPRALNNYNMKNARTSDAVIELAGRNGIYLEWLLDDWTRWKCDESQYIRHGSRDAPCGKYQETFNSPIAREIYKRKLRYVMARWGYSTNILGFELMNECYADPKKCDVSGWHREMGAYIRSFKAQPHMASSSNGSFRLRTSAGIPWTNPSMSFVNFHGYAIPNGRVDWTSLEADRHKWEKLGSALTYPWMDAAVWVDRTSRVHFKRHKWNKPLIWSEYGLIKVDSRGSWRDWRSAYKADSQGRHNKDAIWAGMFATVTVSHWKAGWMLGDYDSGPEKFRAYAPLRNFVAGENFTGLKQETAYPVSDPINPSPQIRCSNGKIMAMSLHGRDRAYLYVKNLTDCWYRLVDPDAVPTPSPQTGTIQIRGLKPGNYTLEQWSTTETNRSRQRLSSRKLTVSGSGTASIHVSLGIGTNCEVAYKLKRNRVKVQSSEFLPEQHPFTIAVARSNHETTKGKKARKVGDRPVLYQSILSPQY